MGEILSCPFHKGGKGEAQKSFTDEYGSQCWDTNSSLLPLRQELLPLHCTVPSTTPDSAILPQSNSQSLHLFRVPVPSSPPSLSYSTPPCCVTSLGLSFLISKMKQVQLNGFRDSFPNLRFYGSTIPTLSLLSFLKCHRVSQFINRYLLL